MDDDASADADAGQDGNPTPDDVPWNAGTAGIFARQDAYLDRYVQFGAVGEKIIRCSFPAEADDEADDEHSLLDRIEDYLDGEHDEFRDVDVGLTVPTEHRAVLEAVRQIDYGEQVAVEQLVRMTAGLDEDDDAAATTVREALDANPVPLLIPDHRVRDGPSGAPPPVEQKLRALEGL